MGERMSRGMFVSSALFVLIVSFSAFVRGADAKSDTCGGMLTGMSGEISTPNYPQPYPTNITCVWRIKGGNSHINLTFLDFQLEGSPTCKAFDYLQVGYRYDRVMRVCGSRPPWMWVVPVEGNNIEFKFHSDTSLSERGFKLTYAKYDVNACLTDNGGCAHICSFKAAKIKCSCKQGYLPRWSDKTQCSDIDECRSWRQSHDCKRNQICVNIPGSFRCVCKAGFRYNNKTDACDEIDECQERKNLCQNGRCRNTIGSFDCDCDPGYSRHVLDKRCEIQICPSGWSQFDSSCYLIPNQKANWTSARTVCRSRGADLVAINSEMENNAVATLVRNHDRSRDTWIGLFKDPKDSSLWLWSDGSRLNFTKWLYDGIARWVQEYHCISLVNSRWTYRDCTLRRSFVCETKVVNGCLTDNGGCAHICSFKAGKVECSCDQGYRLSWNKKNCTESPGKPPAIGQIGLIKEVPCGGVLRKFSGEISTPNYPQQYPNNITCTWRILGTSSHVNLTFSDFELENSVDCNDADYFEVRQGNERHRICGSRKPWVWSLTPNASDVELVFHSDTSLPSRGFKLRYVKYENDDTFGAKNELCGGVLTGPSGEIASPNYPQSYPTNVTCMWQIRSEGSAFLNLTLVEFELEGTPVCKDFDYLELRDVNNNPLSRFCGSLQPETITLPLDGAELKVVFRSDKSLTSKGFLLRYVKSAPEICANVKCPKKYAICVTKTQVRGEPQPTCVCPSCPRSRRGRKVCGSDGYKYPNLCVLQRTSCLLGQNIAAVNQGQGKCVKETGSTRSLSSCANVKCRKYAVCNMKTSGSGKPRPKCMCPACPPGGTSVCGSDGYKYRSVCELRRTACQLGQDIEEVAQVGGQCTKPTLAPVPTSSTGERPGPQVDKCAGFKCYNELEVCVVVKGAPKCMCPACPRGTRKQVCGSDGYKYGSLCKLQRTACRLGMEIKTVPAVNGKCPKK